ncbi:hypothetical protein RRU94_24695 [Domibacillus sp. DTU_2020_1001157_1_SI_ALB_TIR_016]|uniref:hypothetical protein n=1 Tax=Domibacillus sp. DTU_2020_1001157_1_SI_ALB_TIR_016 TaxID=3077789 RepID=UPI0028EB7FCE|nr:hypothetical protein [Domibacillus sp. DTU_2020_1001157_1_SI_ALB_TIR_016]WNS80625.1 hypothetical protein RRU94_24695 [Domibacillus sp. DTU_2020_1001157_1_SI_ALB_TIR_016]
MYRLFFGLLLFLLLLIIKSPLFRGTRIDASYGAMIMAIGIFSIGVFPQLHIPLVLPSYLIDAVLFFIWLFLIFSFMKAALRGVFRKRYLTHPVQSFAVGTWVAATSILCLVLFHQFPFLQPVIFTVALLNTGLWAFYMVLCLKSYKVILSAKYYTRIHGIVFLSTVSTQSLVILFNTLFQTTVLQLLSRFVIAGGLSLYFLNLVLVIIRFQRFRRGDILDGWKNTNCIIHGAMSISGIAAIVSGAFTREVILVMWIWAALLFFIIESIELWRMAARLQAYSLHEAIGRYHVSQWARNFTFGTFYMFTIHIDFTHAPAPFVMVQQLIVQSGIPVLILLLLAECMLFFKDSLPWSESRDHVKQRA